MPLSKSESLFLATAVIAALLVTAAFALPEQTPDRTEKNRQSITVSAETHVAPTSLAKGPMPAAAATEAAPVSAFASAAVQNGFLKNSLSWTFGGKRQLGWTLYLPLISSMLNVEKDADTSDFAEALSRWQQSAGVAPSGILDSETLMAMVSVWQSRRLKERSYPSPDKLITAPVTDFYDPTRPAELRQVEREAYAAYKRMVAAAAADPTLGLRVTPNGELSPAEKYLKIISSFRSREYQERLRRRTPHAGRAGLAANSPHFTGRALDIYVGGDPVETKDANRAIQVQTPVYKWLVKNAEKFGFRPYYYEPWHWEYCPE